MGEVFLAEQKSVKTRVAIKTLLPHISSDNDQVQRFFNEAVAVSRIKHAGIAKIFDVGFLPCGRAYLAMEYLEGETLTRRIRRSRATRTMLLGILITLVVSLEERDEIASLDKPSQPVAVQITPIVATPATSAPPRAEPVVDREPPPRSPPPTTRRIPVSKLASRVDAREHREGVRAASPRVRTEPEPIDPYAAPPARARTPAPKADVTPDAAEELDDAAVAVGLSTVHAQVSACASRSPDPGTVEVRVGVDMFGHVAEVSLVQATAAEVSGCVVDELRSATFPNTRNGGWFSHRFVFD